MNNDLLSLSREEKQDFVYGYYARKIYTASQTIELIEELSIWPVADENDWWNWVAEVREQADEDDEIKIAFRASQEAAGATEGYSGYHQVTENGESRLYGASMNAGGGR
jgi:hypothetical protein